jgi:hypothetical protein
MRASLHLLALSALAFASSAMAADADLLRCRAIADPATRVACYDAIPVAVPAKAAVAVHAADPAANFGLSAAQMRKPSEPEAVESTLLGSIDGWGPGTIFRLANGQTWRVADDSSNSITEQQNPKIRITRNALGTLFMEIEGTNKAPRVRRLN